MVASPLGLNWAPCFHTHQRNKIEKLCAHVAGHAHQRNKRCSKEILSLVDMDDSPHWRNMKNTKRWGHLAEANRRNSLALVGRTRCPLQTVARHPSLQAWHPWLEMAEHHSPWASWGTRWACRHQGCWTGSPQGSQAGSSVVFGPLESGAFASGSSGHR